MTIKDKCFCLDLTEFEHDIIEGMLSELCKRNDMELSYYRKVKTGHIPMIREVKIRYNADKGNKYSLFQNFMEFEGLWRHAKHWKDGELVPFTEEEKEENDN